MGAVALVKMTDALIDDYVNWCGLKPDDPMWLRLKEIHLDFWKFCLEGRDLAKVKLATIHDILAGKRDVEKKKVVLKHFYTFLRQTGRIEQSEDPVRELAVEDVAG